MLSVRFRCYKHFIISSIGRAKDNKSALYTNFWLEKNILTSQKIHLLLKKSKGGMYMVNGYIYCITNKINNKCYVGKTLDSVESRFQQHIYDSEKQAERDRPLYAAFHKYGIENFYIETLEEVPYQELSLREQYWITKKNSFHNGYNATLGGDGKVLYDYEAIIQKFQEGALVKEIAEYFNCHIDTVSRILKLAGENGYKNYANSKKKQVKLISKKGFEKIFDSRADAARWLVEEGYTSADSISGIAAHISQVTSGKRKSYLDFHWEDV